MISVTSSSRAAREKGPMMPASTGRSVMISTALRMDSTYSPERAAPTAGISKALASSSSFTRRPTTVGTSSFDTRTAAPKHSASTDKSMRETAAAELTLSATSFMPCAWRSLSEISSRTVTPKRDTEGKERMGKAVFLSAEIISDSHCFISRFIKAPCIFVSQNVF